MGILRSYMELNAGRVEALMGRLFARKAREPEAIRKAMRYSIFAGGKRLRPTLVIAAAECCGLPGRKALKTAAALEMVHTYSLIHDDLPAMDDDDLRRGKPTNHKVFGEALAILAGDGLLTYAFETIAENALELRLPARASAELVRLVARGAGTRGMVAGQVADLEAENWRKRNHGFSPKKALEYIHLHKTAALIVASLEAGAVLAQASAPRRKALRAYGRAVGLAFQIADDVLDVVGDKKKLGKKGSDARNKKLTYATLYGVEEAKRKAAALAAEAQKHLDIFTAERGNRAAGALRELARYIVTRDK